MLNLPTYISEYLDECTIGRAHHGYICLNPDGKITSWSGKVDMYNEHIPVVGDDIYEYCSILEGILPLESKQAVLPRIEMKQDVFADIHLVFYDDKYWVIFIDSTEIVENLRDFLQEHNENELNKSKNDSEPEL